ncbi:MAG: type II secretion system protein [Candidatus Omnitrophica bacterium]|nr:type II secretion system protein [Candidatus Omnitrophota bacterium]
MRPLINRRSLTLMELLIALCVVFILLGSFAIYANMTLRIARETALQMELNNIRMSIEHYCIINGKPPEDLNILLNQEFVLRTQEGVVMRDNFLKPFRVDKYKKLLDPFLNRYYYDNSSGAVKTLTKKYENW